MFSCAISATICIAGNKKSWATEPAYPNLPGKKWHIQSQYFASHDEKGTDRDTVQGRPDDYIDFRPGGIAYCYFNGQYDTLEYKLIGKDSISFGDTPFSISIIHNPDHIQLFQNEEEKNGDYNRVWYILSQDKKEISQAYN